MAAGNIDDDDDGGVNAADDTSADPRWRSPLAAVTLVRRISSTGAGDMGAAEAVVNCVGDRFGLPPSVYTRQSVKRVS
jgi:hypothetical protein